MDLKLAQYTTGQTGDRAGFLKYSALVHKIQSLQEKREQQKAFAEILDEVLTSIALTVEDSETNEHVQVVHEEAKKARKHLDELVKLLFCMSSTDIHFNMNM